MFEPTTHPLVGTERTYLPKGYSPYRRVDATPETVVLVGDTVTVESAWTRPYLPAGSETLLYVISHHTGKRTHVVAADLINI